MALVCCSPRTALNPWTAWKGLETELGQLLKWAPAVDLRESEEAYTIEADVPGFAQEDIDIQVEGNLVTLKGERKTGRETSEDAYHRVERRSGTFERSFDFGHGFDADKVVANLEHGVLRVTLPKREDAKPKPIKVTVN